MSTRLVFGEASSAFVDRVMLVALEPTTLVAVVRIAVTIGKQITTTV